MADQGHSGTPQAERHPLRHGLGFLASGAAAFIVDAAVLALLTSVGGVHPIAARLVAGRERGEISGDYSDEELEILAWALMGANVFLGLRFAVWSSREPKQVADAMNRLLRSGLAQ